MSGEKRIIDLDNLSTKDLSAKIEVDKDTYAESKSQTLGTMLRTRVVNNVTISSSGETTIDFANYEQINVTIASEVTGAVYIVMTGLPNATVYLNISKPESVIVTFGQYYVSNFQSNVGFSDSATLMQFEVVNQNGIATINRLNNHVEVSVGDSGITGYLTGTVTNCLYFDYQITNKLCHISCKILYTPSFTQNNHNFSLHNIPSPKYGGNFDISIMAAEVGGTTNIFGNHYLSSSLIGNIIYCKFDSNLTIGHPTTIYIDCKYLID